MKTTILKKQLGQALPLGIALFLVLGVASFALFNTGKTVTDKTRIVNTADSAAYSGLLWQARAMNFTAYTNRAMVANQVAMAQAVSLNSWSGYFSKTGQNIHSALGGIPYVGAVTGIIQSVSTILDNVLTPVSQGMLTVVKAINVGISVAQEGMYLATFAATPDVINTVVKSNDIRNQNFTWETGFSLMNTGYNLSQWKDLTAQYEKTDTAEMLERAEMVNLSLDKFTKERDWRFFGFFIPISPINWVRLEKHGTTKLSQNANGDDWEIQANDALSIRSKLYTFFGTKYNDIPIGGGSSIANSGNSSDSIINGTSNFHGNRHRIAKRREPGISSLFHDARTMTGYDGMEAYRSLTTEWRQSDEPPRLKLRIEVTMSPEDIVSSQDLVGQTTFSSDIHTPGSIISSVSAAELYFERPCIDNECMARNNRSQLVETEEYADGYSPYWDVRLAENEHVSRLAAYALHIDTLSESSPYGVSSAPRLRGFNDSNATPLNDFEDQKDNVERTNETVQSLVASLEQDAPEFAQYQSMLTELQGNMIAEIDDIAADFLDFELDEGDIVERLAKAADFDFNRDEFENLKGAVGSVYGHMSDLTNIDELTGEFQDMLDQVAGSVEEHIKSQLEDELRNAVRNIIAGMVGNTIANYTGGEISDDLIEQATNVTTDQILNVNVTTTDDTDLDFNLGDECAVYGLVHNAELEVVDLQDRLASANQAIADRFHHELIDITNTIVDERSDLADEITALQGLIVTNGFNTTRTFENTTYTRYEDYNRAVRAKIDEIRTERDGKREDRMVRLSYALMLISDEETARIGEFENFRLEYRFARRAVDETVDMMGQLEADQDGYIISDQLFFTGVGEEDSDSEQEHLEAPEGC